MDKLKQFAKLFGEYNAHTNLMSRKEIENLECKHIPDSLSINAFFKKHSECKTLVDIGTGGGLPSIPVAIKYPQLNVYAIDSVQKKIKFIENVKNELKLDNLYPICIRIEDFEKREYFDIATTRAVAELSTVLEYCSPFVKTGGYVVAYKSKSADEELAKAQNAIKLLNLEFSEKIDVSENLSEERYLLIFRKTKKNGQKYPRKNNQPRKNPL